MPQTHAKRTATPRANAVSGLLSCGGLGSTGLAFISRLGCLLAAHIFYILLGPDRNDPFDAFALPGGRPRVHSLFGLGPGRKHEHVRF